MRRLAAPVGTAARYLALLLAAAVVLLPFGWTLLASFVRRDIDLNNLALPLDGYWLGHYRDILTQTYAVRWLVNSILVTLVILAGNLIFNTMAGYALARIRFRGSSIALGVIVATMMLPPQILFEPIYTMIIRLGWLNSYQALIVPFLVNPFGVFLMRQFFATLPRDLFDAGRVDGVSEFGLFWRIGLPLVGPGLAALGIFNFVGNWNAFLWPLIVAKSPSMRTLPVGVAFFSGEAGTAWNLIMASSALAVIPVLVVFFVFQRQIIEGVVLTGVKG